MRRALRPCTTAGVVLVGAGLVAAVPTATVPDVQVRALRLTSGDAADSPLGDGTAFIIGASGISTPPQGYVDAVDTLYLQPRGFIGTAQGLDTPEGLYPVTGVKSLTLDASLVQDQHILDGAIQQHITGGGVDGANPVVVFGWSQSSAASGPTMQQLATQGVPSDDVHFVLVGDPNSPNGGMLERFDLPAGTSPSVPSLGITFSGATPDDLYPTDIYSTEYDLAGDFPQYPIDPLSDINALLGLVFDHLAYPGLTAGQIQDAIQLPTSTADTMTNYYMIPTETLPLLVPLQWIPVVGQPLVDLLQPDLRVLVNLGYGSISDGWSPGDADVPTTLGLFPTNLNWPDVFTALGNGLQQGISAAINDLQNTANYQPTSIFDNPTLSELVNVANALGYTDGTSPSQLLTNFPSLLDLARTGLSDFANLPISDATLQSSPTDLLNDLIGTVSADYATLLPIADAATALLTSLPAYDASVFVDQLQAGDLLGAIGEPIAADFGLLALLGGFVAAPPIAMAVGTTLLNFVDLIPGS